jgi:predicted DCC family thiol-disulfide oxidoreductase YuxK
MPYDIGNQREYKTENRFRAYYCKEEHARMVLKRKRPISVYYDGSCPLCSREISFYRKRRGAESVAWVDVSQPRNLPADLSRAEAMARFHVRDANGRLVDGGYAFAELWKQFPVFRWAGVFFSSPATRWILALGYNVFLPFRPRIQSLFGSRREPEDQGQMR